MIVLTGYILQIQVTCYRIARIDGHANDGVLHPD